MLITSRSFWFAAVFVFAAAMIMIRYWKFMSERGHGIHKIALVLYAVYLSAMIVLVLYPAYMLRPFRFSTERVNIVPFRSLNRFLTNPLEPIENIILFIPFGFFSVLNDKVKAGRRILNAVWRSALLSIGFEVFQLWISRVSDIDDVIVNTLGGLIGALICVAWHKTRLDHTRIGEKIMPELPKRWRGRIAVPRVSAIVLICYSIALLSVNAVLTHQNSTDLTANIHGHESHFSIEAKNAMLFERGTGEILFAEQADDAIYPASAVKLVTCLTALDIAGPDTLITPGSELMAIPFDCSRAGIKMGMEYTLRELICGALLPSGADACYTMGIYCGRQLLDDPSASNEAALEAFINAANEKLRSLGAQYTLVKNVEGIDEEGQLTTAKDLCVITGAVLDTPILAEICAAASVEIGPENDRILLVNTNKMVCSDSDFFLPDFIGVKTGATSCAGNCLIGAFARGGETYITIIMNSGYDGKFTDTKTLHDLVPDI